MSIYGQLNKEFVTPNYTGVNTSSVKTTVDNTKRTIQAEVIWKDMLGEEYGKAYPGHLGVANAERIATLTALLQEEIKRATTADTSVNAQMKQLKSSVDTSIADADKKIAAQGKQLDKLTEDVTLRIIEEVSRALSAEAELLNKLNNEIKDRSDFDAQIKAKVDAMSGNVSDVATMIEEAIQTEQERAQKAEENLGYQLFNEQARATKAESDINKRLTATVDTFEAKTNLISTDLASEVQTRTSQISALEAALTAEVDRSIAVDAELDAAIESLKTVDFETTAKLINIDKKNAAQDDAIESLQLTDNELRAVIDKVIDDVANQSAESLGIDKLIKEETERAEAVEEAIQTSLNATIEDVMDNAMHIHQLKTAQAKNIEDITSLQTATEGLDVAAINNDLSNIHSDVAAVTTALNQEVSRATQFDEETSNDIKTLETAVENLYETTASLYTNVKDINDSITELTDDTTAKFNAVDEQFSEFDTELESEMETREAADADLDIKLSQVSSELEKFVRRTKNDGATEVYAVTGEIDHSVIASADVTANGIVIRDESGNIALQKIITDDDFEKFDDHDAVSKIYVNLLMADFQEKVDSRITKVSDFDFIDGGNAPV